MMLRIFYLLVAVMIAGLVGSGNARAGAPDRQCDKLDEQVSGPEMKYSMIADVNGFAAFADIGCSIEWRNRELCATELASFDITAKVFDFRTGRELEMAKAYYVVNESAPADTPIIAFAAEDEAAKYVADHGSGKVVDFTNLTGFDFR